MRGRDRVARFEEVRQALGEDGKRAAYGHFCREGSMPSVEQVRLLLGPVDPGPPAVPGGMMTSRSVPDTKFWVVRDPQPYSEPGSVVTETGSSYLREVVGAGLQRVEQEHHRIHVSEENALEDAIDRLSRLESEAVTMRAHFERRLHALRSEGR